MFQVTFTPITWSHELSHGNLSGDDFTDCLFKFFHMVCAIAIGQNYQKALIFARDFHHVLLIKPVEVSSILLSHQNRQ